MGRGRTPNTKALASRLWAQWLTIGVLSTFLGGILWLSHPSSTVRAGLTHLMGGQTFLLRDRWLTIGIVLIFLGGLPPHVPSVIHGPDTPDPSHGGSPLVSASVASTLPLAAPLLRPLMHEDLSDSSALDLTMSFWVPTSAGVAPPVVPQVVPPVGPPVVPLPPIPAPAPWLPMLLSRHRGLFLLPRL